MRKEIIISILPVGPNLLRFKLIFHAGLLQPKPPISCSRKGNVMDCWVTCLRLRAIVLMCTQEANSHAAGPENGGRPANSQPCGPVISQKTSSRQPTSPQLTAVVCLVSVLSVFCLFSFAQGQGGEDANWDAMRQQEGRKQEWLLWALMRKLLGVWPVFLKKNTFWGKIFLP
jgi:hypothetical protein